jgi:arsenite-transporting ATPase
MPSSPTADARFVFFGGKGGVGKTTCAAATALGWSASQRVLALSLDPAHSLRDVLDPERLKRTSTAQAHEGARIAILELDAHQEFAEFMSLHREELRTIAGRGTYFDDEDIRGFLDLSLPGLDEIMGLLKLGELAQSGEYDRVVADLPPTGHALRLFDVSRAFAQLVDALELMQDKHRFTVSSLTRRYTPDAIDAFVQGLQRNCAAARDALLAPGTSAFVLVAQPQPMVLAESARYAARLEELGGRVSCLVMNAAAGQMELPPALRGLPCVRVPRLDRPPIGPERLRQVWHWLRPLCTMKPPSAAGEEDSTPAAQAYTRQPAQDSQRKAAERKSGGLAHPREKPLAAGEMGRGLGALLADPRQVTIFGGKGGVGKTTLAAATALALAERCPTQSVVVVSIDPAHSLGDSFGQPLGAAPRPIRRHPNLQALELDPAQPWLEFQEHWTAEAQQLFAGLAGGQLDPVYDRQIAAQLSRIQPTGLDELQAATALTDLVDEDPERLVLTDSAPTGHLIRFLESPELVLAWTKELMRVLLKYKLASRLKQLSEDLLTLSRQTKALQAMLHDPARCELIVVTLAEPAVVAETQRLLERLKTMRVPVRRVIVNQVAGEGRERAEIKALRKRFPGLQFIEIARQPQPVQGIAALEALAA